MSGDDMGVELRDMRAKILAETDQVIDAIARTSGKDKAEIVREWLGERARDELHRAKMIVSLAQREGSPGKGAA